MTTHYLKTWPEQYQAVLRREKTFEFRKDDRDFKVFDHLVLREWNPETGGYTGDATDCLVSYVVRGPSFGVPDGYCVMSIVVEKDASNGV